MSAKTGAVIGSLVFLVAALRVVTAQPYQPDDPVPPGSVFRVINLESRIIDLQYRVEAASDVVAKSLDSKAKQPGIASGPHSTMSSDFLYLAANPDAVATLTIRVADQQGQPLQGKRVQVASAVSGGPTDAIIQPEAPTDADGIATARVKPSTPPHTARFSARVLQDNVDIGQVVEIEVQNPGPPSFFPPAFAPYFDEKHFVVNPTPLKVGQPTTITVPLTNLRKVPVEARVRFFSNVPNIGLGHWPQIGETETFILQPGESREAKITWTPTAESHHLCFKAEIWGRELPPRAAAGPWPGWLQVVRSAFAQSSAAPATTGSPTLMDSRQQNIGPVTPSSCDKARACEAIDDLIKLIDYYDNVHSPTLGQIHSFRNFARDFDKLFQKLANKDLACRYDPGATLPPEVSTLLGGILRNRNGIKTLNAEPSVFPFHGCADIRDHPGNQPECDDSRAIEDSRAKLDSLAASLSCPRQAPSPTPGPGPKGCSAGEEKASDGSKEALDQIIDGFNEALEKADEELRLHPESEGVRDRIDQIEKVIAFWGRIKAASCVPNDVLQSLEEARQRREGACPDLCNATFNWMKQMGATSDGARTAFMLSCTQACEKGQR